uniref:Dirigent protein n=1 Tax=Romanomermis culicivorax TaxID=13658 RepID=A0A915L2W6_ROMCU
MAAAPTTHSLLLILIAAAASPVRPSSVTVTDPFDDIIHLPFVGSLFFVDHNESLAGKSAHLKFGSEQLWSGTLTDTGFVEVPPARRKAGHSPVHLGQYVLSIGKIVSM